jgi:ketosteroid isomerase-like protein
MATDRHCTRSSDAAIAMNAIFRCISPVVLIAIVLGAASAPGYGDTPRLGGDTTKAAEVWSTLQNWLRAYKAGDVAQIMAIFDQEVVFSFQGAKDQSYADLQRGYEVDLKERSPGAAWVPLVEQVYADGNLAFVRAAWELQATPMPPAMSM